MNGIEPKPHERDAYCSKWLHPDDYWTGAVIVEHLDGWEVSYWHVVSSGGIEYNGKLYDWSDPISFDTRSAAEHYAQLVWDMKLYD